MKFKITLLILASIFLALSFVSANFPCDWNTYGGNINKMSNFQYYDECKSLFNDTTITTLSYSAGQNYANANRIYQPIVVDADVDEKNLLFIPNGNFLQIYDGTMLLVNDINIGMSADSQIDAGDLNGDGAFDDIAGIWKYNSTQLNFRLYKYNKITKQISLNTETNFTNSNANFGSSGLRCVTGSNGLNGTCYTTLYSTNSSGTYHMNFTTIYTNGSYTEKYIGFSQSYPREPLSWNDWNNDATDEFLLWTDYDIIVLNGATGTQTLKINCGDGSFNRCRGAKFYYPLPSTTPTWLGTLLGISGSSARLIYTQERGNTLACGGGTFFGYYIASIKSDGSSSWSSCIGTTNSGDTARSYGLAIADYNGDNKEDVWIVRGVSGSNPLTFYQILKGEDGSTLFSNQSTAISYAGSYPNTDLSLAYLDNDATPDFLFRYPTRVSIFSPAKDIQLFSSTTPTTACSPADLSYDGLQDVVCISTTNAYQFTPDYTNQLPNITSITYDANTILSVGSTLNTIVSATDVEGDIIRYAVKCSDSDTISSWDGSNVKSCTFNVVGTFNVTNYVSDIFHDFNNGEYRQFSQIITITSTGLTCNNNGICDSGETNLNCPNDCFSAGIGSTSSEGGSPIPTQLVDTQGNTETGLLPEIYYGILGFLSYVLVPMIWIVFMFLGVFVIIAIGKLIRKVADNVSG